MAAMGSPPLPVVDVVTLPKFCYDRLPDEPSLRLVRIVEASDGAIRLTLHSFSQAEASEQEYVALSYTWGSPWPREPSSAAGHGDQAQGGTDSRAERDRKIICNDSCLQVTRNLEQALMALHPVERYLWIDAISINQEDLDERSAQVARMGQIFSKAHHVVAWLGPADATSPIAFAFIKDMAPRLRPHIGRDPSEYMDLDFNDRCRRFWQILKRTPMTEDEALAVRRLFKRTYFNRIWVIQEAVFARKIRLRCGSDALDWAHLVLFSTYLFCAKKVFHAHPLARYLVSDSLDKPFEFVPSIINSMRIHFRDLAANPTGIVTRFESFVPKGEPSPEQAFCLVFERAIHTYQIYEASLSCDKLFAPASLALHFFSGCIRPDFFVPNYHRSPEELYTETAGKIIHHGKSLFLLTLREPLIQRVRHSLPSWVPDFPMVSSVSLEDSFEFDAFGRSDLDCDVKTSGRVLSTVGILHDTVTSTEPQGRPSHRLSFDDSAIDLLEFSLNLDEVYPNGEASIDAFFRTIIGDLLHKYRPEVRRKVMRKYLLHSFVASKIVRELFLKDLRRYGPHASGVSLATDFIKHASWSGLQAVLDRFEARHVDSVPTFADVVAWLRQMCSSSPGVDVETYNTEKSMLDEAYLKVMAYRCLFISQRGYIGLVPWLSRAGDEIWLVPGRKVPMLFRRDGSDDSVRLIGDAYVHGIMFGEQKYEAADLQPLVIK